MASTVLILQCCHTPWLERPVGVGLRLSLGGQDADLVLTWRYADIFCYGKLLDHIVVPLRKLRDAIIVQGLIGSLSSTRRVPQIFITLLLARIKVQRALCDVQVFVAMD